MDLRIPYASVTDKKQAFEGAKRIIPEALVKFNVKADVTLDEQACLLIAKGSGFEVCVQFNETDCEVKCDFSFLLKPFKGKILEVLEKQIKKVI